MFGNEIGRDGIQAWKSCAEKSLTVLSPKDLGFDNEAIRQVERIEMLVQCILRQVNLQYLNMKGIQSNNELTLKILEACS